MMISALVDYIIGECPAEIIGEFCRRVKGDSVFKDGK